MVDHPPAIVLATLNAKYIHASLGLRYLLANMARHGGDDLRARTLLREFTIARAPQRSRRNCWRSSGHHRLRGLHLEHDADLRSRAFAESCTTGYQGGAGRAEVSHELDEQTIVKLADHVITGWAM